MDVAVEQVKLSGREDAELKQNNSNNTQLQRPKEPSELQQIHVRKLLIAIQTMLDDFASSQKKCSCCEKEEVIVAAKIEKAQQNIGRLPKSDNPEYIRLKKLKWEHKIQLACNCYIKTLNQFQIENEGFVAFLKLFQKELKRVLNSLVAVQPLPESMRNVIAGGNKLFNLDASIENEAARKVQKVILKPIPEIGIKEPKVQLSTVLEDEEKMVNKEKNDDGNKKGPETIFGIIFIGIIIACLPTIMGLFSLCVIAYFIYLAAKSLFEGETEKTDAGHDGCEPDSKQDRSAEWQSVQDKQKSETERKQNSYSGYSSSYRSSSYDGYDDYYDDWHDNDMPPEEGDGFRGTGGPFL